MKKLFLSLITIVLIGVNTFAQDKIIGEDRNGEFVITANLDYVLDAWNNLLTNQKIDTKLETLAIKSGKFENTGEDYFILIAYNKDKSTKVACMIISFGIFFHLSELEFTTTVTCSGCVEGCDPEATDNGKAWKCANPCDKCNKTVSISY